MAIDFQNLPPEVKDWLEKQRQEKATSQPGMGDLQLAESQRLQQPIDSTQTIKLTPSSTFSPTPERPGMGDLQLAESLRQQQTPITEEPIQEEREPALAPMPKRVSSTQLPVVAVKEQPKPSEVKSDLLNEFREAKRAGGLIDLISILGKSGSQIGAGIAGGAGKGPSIATPKVDTSVFDQIGKMSEEPVKQFAVEKQLKEEAELKDPNSAYSKMMRDTLVNKLGVNPEVLQGLPGHELDKVFGNIVKIKGIEETTKSRQLTAQNLNDQREFTRKMAEAKLEELKNERSNKQLDSFVKYIDPTQKPGGAFAGYQKTIDAANRLKPLLFTEDGKLANPNKQMMEEIAIAVNTLIAGSGGSRSRAQIESLLPDTYKGKLNDFLQKITNEPVGRDQQKFVEQFATLVNRETKVASDSIVKEIDKRANSLRPRIRDKDTFDEAVSLRKAEYSPSTTSGKSTVKLPSGHILKAGDTFKAKGKIYKVNEDETATEI